MSYVLDTRDLAVEMEELLSKAEKGELEDYEGERLADLTQLDSQFDNGLAGQEMYDPIMIAEDYFETYAEELAKDIGAISDDYSWPHSHIDWEAAANHLKMDYWEVEFENTTFLLRG